MPADSQNTPSFFRDDPDSQNHLKEDGSDPIIEDFNAFFEKLSSLDDLQWTSGEGDDPGKGMAKAVGEQAPPPRKKAAQPAPRERQGTDSKSIARRAAARYADVKSPRKRPKVEVVSSEKLTAHGGVAISGAKVSSPGQVSHGVSSPDESFDTARAARILKLALVSLILFGLGLGAGWAALSFPNRFDNLIPAVKNASGPVTPVVGASESMDSAGEGKGMGTAGKLGAWFWGNHSKGSKTSSTSQNASGHPAQSGKQTPVGAVMQTGDGQAQGASVEEGTDPEFPTGTAGGNPSEIKPIEVPKVDSDGDQHAATVVQNADQAETIGQEQTSLGDFALQVGACSSYRCVESFRNLLLGQVHSGSIKVLSQTAPNGEGVIQRIRIEPLTRVEAERLKAALVADNPQFQGTYLVKAH